MDSIDIFYLILDVLSTSGNVAMTVRTIKSKKFRSRFFVFVGDSILIRIVIGCQYVPIFIYRSLRTLNLVETNIVFSIANSVYLRYYLLGVTSTFGHGRRQTISVYRF